MNDTVTTIIPTYRRPKLLRRAILSALAQTHDDIRVCVYDNASGDETPAVVAEIAARDSRVAYYRHAQHIGVVENFLFGMRQVASPYFSFLSDDDVLFPNFYASAVAKLRTQPDALFAAGSAIEFDEGGSVRYAPLALWPREGRFSPPEGFYMMLHNRHPTWTAVLFRQEAMRCVGTLDPQVGGPADLDYELAIAARFPYVIFFEASAGYVHHSNRVSALEDAGIVAGYERLANKLSADVRIDPSLRAALPRLLEGQMRAKLYEIAIKSVVAGTDDNARAAASLLRSRFQRPLAAACIRLAAGSSSRAPLIRKAIAGLELVRLSMRSARARLRLKATIGCDGSSYAKFLR